jgi:hypothetical protein
MSSYLPRSLRAFSIGELYQIPNNPKKAHLGTYALNEDLILVTSGTFNIVLCKEIRKNVEIAAVIAIGLARKYPDKKILLLNSYAGTELLKFVFSKAMWCANGAMDTRSSAEKAAAEDAENGVALDVFSNIRVLDIPMGEWSTERVGQEITEYGSEIIVWNSFEFSAINRYRREIVAREMLKLRDEYNLTVVVFSHEMRRDVKAGIPSRGAIGMLSAYADSVWRLQTEEEWLKPPKQPGIPTIHEQKTQKNEVTNSEKKENAPETRGRFPELESEKEDDDWVWDPAKEEEEWAIGWSPYLASNFVEKSEYTRGAN